MAMPSYTSPPGELMCSSMFGAVISRSSAMNYAACLGPMPLSSARSFSTATIVVPPVGSCRRDHHAPVRRWPPSLSHAPAPTLTVRPPSRPTVICLPSCGAEAADALWSGVPAAAGPRPGAAARRRPGRAPAGWRSARSMGGVSPEASAPVGAGTVEQAVHAALATVDDPEINRPITELGMVKSVAVSDGVADVGVFLTVAGCPMRATITKRVTDAVSRVPGITDVRVQLDVMSPDQLAEMKKHLR